MKNTTPRISNTTTRASALTAVLGATLILTACGNAANDAAQTSSSQATAVATDTNANSLASQSTGAASTAPLATGQPKQTWTPTHTPDPNVNWCPADAIEANLVADQGGSAILSLTNTSTKHCETRGYPGVAFVNRAGGDVIGASAIFEGATGEQAIIPQTVGLAPGQSAVTQLSISQALKYPVETCEPTPAAGFQVIVPETEDPLFVPMDGLTACAGSVELLHVLPLSAGDR